MILRRAQPSENRIARDWIKARHYTKAAPPGFRVVLEFLRGNEVPSRKKRWVRKP